MSSTSVRSEGEKRKNLYVTCGQTIADERGRIEIPPATALEGPSRLDVVQGTSMELVATNSVMHRDGTLTLPDGTKVASFDKKVFEVAKNKKEEKIKADTKTSKSTTKGTGRGE